MRFTLEDIVKFCWKYGKKGFRNYGWEEIANHIVWAADNGKLLYVVDGRRICGVCTYSEYPGRLYIHHIVAKDSGFATLIEVAREQFPGHTITGLRNSKLVTFKPRHLWAILHRQQRKLAATSSTH